ncbi:glutamine--fructose-6-phosphate transaminase (isomerizing) [candidate division WOR-3 bacterium 4484_100]|uniref:Glutamine--fructose-6-phosphate aminotransferase [isomerizing] n=1 Tax=candidate division WOR-3 bacterium 4484_100 TaxID=1936077 RepID=A0A1V4QH22_UNCW3|nr:MAG: glutamine--fructose-6-phosphate transaminase (isomerizing) [candidate division WOR-3 bacterium 4484_100]
MCGIVGYIGKDNATRALISGLYRLEYRGYDSAGIALLTKDNIFLKKVAGRVSELDNAIRDRVPDASIGIAHTRWATHGVPNDINAHPHTDCEKRFAVVHNGIIENYRTLKKFLEKKGHRFETDTDTEVIPHLIEEFYDNDLMSAVKKACSYFKGTYGLAIISLANPDCLVVTRMGSPLVIGKGKDEYIVASDLAAIISYTDKVIYLNDGDVAEIHPDRLRIESREFGPVAPEIERVTLSLEQIERGGYKHFMLKEIYEQPVILRDTIRGRLNYEEGIARLHGIANYIEKLRDAERIIIIACGTSWHAGLIGEYMIESLAEIPVEVEYSSEFRYRRPVLKKGTICIVVSQSGETADTLAALREAKRHGATVLGICNVVGSSIARETDAGIYIHAGPEIGVASTKAFMAQIMTFALLSLLLGRLRRLPVDEGRDIINAIRRIPDQIQSLLEELPGQIKELARTFKDHRNFLYLGRGYNFPVALEGALKLKEISYIHAEGYPAAEMKHGPIALIDKNMPVVVIAIKDAIYDKVISNIEEIRTRQGIVIAVGSEGDSQLKKNVDHIIYVPKTLDHLYPLLTILPLQLLAYYIADFRGLDVDKPRNLAKSVTVE